MRLDKFLKVSRIIRKRSVTEEIADKGRIQINGKLAEPSNDVRVGGILKIQFGDKTLKVETTRLHESAEKEDIRKIYEITSEDRTEALEE